MTRLKQKFKDEVIPAMKKRFDFTNDLQVPTIKKIVISRGVNADEGKSGNVLDEMVADIAMLGGQKPIVRKAKKSIATFKLREGMPNGIMVTLRGDRMYAFFDRLVSIAAPRVRDFQGFKIKSDQHGNFTVGLRDQRIFVEVENRQQKGLQLTIVTSANNPEEGRALLEEFGFPFSK